MAVNYKIYQGTILVDGMKKFYARAAYHDTITLKQLAEKMQANCTVKHSDIMAVLTELTETIKSELLNSNIIKIEGLGTFRITLKSTGANTAKEFNTQKNIVGAHLRFIPEGYQDRASRKIVRPLLSGMKLAELSEYKSAKKADVVEE